MTHPLASLAMRASSSSIHRRVSPARCAPSVLTRWAAQKNVHLNLQSLAIGDVSVAVSSLMEPAALSVDATVKVSVTGFVRLCLHDDPFGALARRPLASAADMLLVRARAHTGKGCSTLYGCKGDFSVAVETLSNTTMSVTANAGTGLPSVTVTDEKASVPSLTSSGLCDKISSQLKSASSQIAAALVKDVPAMVRVATRRDATRSHTCWCARCGR